MIIKYHQIYCNPTQSFAIHYCTIAIKRLKRPCMKIQDDACRWNTIKFDAVLPTLRYGTVYEKIYIHRCKHVSRMIAYMFRYIHALHYTTLYYTTVRHTTLHDMAFKLYIPIQTDTSAHMRVSRHTFYRHT
jgi:hypothetical protein